MLGIQDPWVLTAYLGILIAAALSLVYGLARRNAGDDSLSEEDRHWAREEQQLDEETLP